MDQNTSVLQIKGVGEKAQKLFAKINVNTVGELLTHYPRDYEKFAKPVPIAQAEPGTICAIVATVKSVPTEKKVRSLTITNVDVRDSSGVLKLAFFNLPFIKKALWQDRTCVFRGLVKTWGFAKTMEQPVIYTEEEYLKQCGQLLPRYSLTKGLTNSALQRAVKQVLDTYRFEAEYYPQDILDKYHLISRERAIRDIHFPKDYDVLKDARKRLAFDEFFGFILMLNRTKEMTADLANSYPMFETADTVRFLEKIPFALTNAQKKVWGELKADLCGDKCMNRLIQGDVGSGKTILAVLALLMCAANGYQGAMMAPTEVLAMQHFENISEYTSKYQLPFSPVLLVGSMTAKEKREAYERIASGEANLIIGTHALIQEKVEYKNLALVVTDEQHRFGVHQREKLAEKGEGNPHVLVMSATPIPRTLAIILYGDLHLSVVDELPASRLPIKNCVVGTSYRPTAYRFIAGEVAKGRQAYVICPMVEEGEMEELENVVDYAEKLKGALPASVRVSYLHGKMRPADKTRIMNEFAAGDIDVLVSTTVIEVGINVPNATVMMVENSERFGLAQLHQLRGRVGRGEHQSYCVFVSSNERPEVMDRLKILNNSNDGFFIASEDLKLRGPGDLFGVRQSGEFSFQVGDIYNDAGTLQEAAEAVEKLLCEDPRLEAKEHAALRQYYESTGNAVDFRSI